MDRRLGLAILGANYVIDAKVKQYQYNYTNIELLKFYKSNCEQINSEELYNLLKPRWGSAISRAITHKVRVGPRLIWAYLLDLLSRFSFEMK